MIEIHVTGMMCSACSAKVEKEVKKIKGVTTCEVNFLTGMLRVDGTAKAETIIKAVKKAGYGIDEGSLDDFNERTKIDLRKKVRRIVMSVLLLFVLVYFSMVINMGLIAPPRIMFEIPFVRGIVQMVLALIVMIINREFFIKGIKGLIKLVPNMDTLVSLGSLVAFIYSSVLLILSIISYLEGDWASGGKYVRDMYYESAAMIVTFVSIGKYLEEKAKGKTTDAIYALMEKSPKTAVILKGDKEVEVSIDEIKVGDEFILKAGYVIPVDGIVIEGDGAVDESALTGESIPVNKEIDDRVSAATVMLSGYMVCKATEVGENTTFSKIIEMVKNAVEGKAPISRVADRISGIFVPTVMILSLLTFIIWFVVGVIQIKITGVTYIDIMKNAVKYAAAVLVISCPCALGLATPCAIMVGNGVAAKKGILFKSAQDLENAGKSDVIVFDKTGTITKGQIVVSDVKRYSDGSVDPIMLAAVMEQRSAHPVAKAVIEYGKTLDEKLFNEIKDLKISEYAELAGRGLKGYVEVLEDVVYVGNYEYIKDSIADKEIDSQRNNENNEKNRKNKVSVEEYVDILREQGKITIVIASAKNGIWGVIGLSDEVKADSREAIAKLKDMKKRVVMLTGDNEKAAAFIAGKVGIEEFYSEVYPEDKGHHIEMLQGLGKKNKPVRVAMVGDGINDAPALAISDMGIAMGQGADIAALSSGVIIIGDSLMEVTDAIGISKMTLRIIRQNLFWAFLYNVICIPLAAGVFVPLFGIGINPMIGALCMSLSSFCVVSNSLRIYTYK